jgi:hypothetical protein
MRDDILGLSFIRMFPFEQKSLARPAGPLTSDFANALKRATAARTESGHPLQRYVSPMQQSTRAHASSRAHHPLAPRPAPQGSTAIRQPSTAPQRSPTTPAPALARPAPASSAAEATPDIAWSLNAYPHPNGDNGRGMHWIPTTKQSPAAIDRFVAEAQRMGIKWVTFLNNGANIGDNDYLVNKLVGAGIEPVMRLYTPTLEPIQGDIAGMVRHYSAMGVHYFQPFNEPNLEIENPDGKVSVDRYLDAWIPAARAIMAGGGLPGFGSMAPGGDLDDQQFLKQALEGLKSRGETHLLDRAWLSMHNYTWNHPIEDRGDGDGFFKFRAYHQIVQQALGRDLPVIGTEGGTFTGEQEDPKMAAVTPDMAATWTQQSFTYMRTQREPWLFTSSVWTIADLAGGASDPRFEAQALFKADGTKSSVATALETLG